MNTISASAPKPARSNTAPAAPTESNSSVANADPHCTETIEASTSSAAPRVLSWAVLLVAIRGF
jgi:hypothetical protein